MHVPPLTQAQVSRLKEVVEALKETDAYLEVTCSVSTGLRLRPETARPLGLNPFHLALTDTAFSSLAVQGHVRRAHEGDTGLELQQDLIAELLNLLRSHANMGYYWSIYELNAGQELDTTGLRVRFWHQQMAHGIGRARETTERIMGHEHWETVEHMIVGPAMMPY